MSDEVVAQSAGGQVPDLDQAVPSGRDDERDLLGRGEVNTRNPVLVSFGIARDGVLALSESVPKTNGSISGACGIEQMQEVCETLTDSCMEPNV